MAAVDGAGDWWPATVTDVFDYPETRTISSCMALGGKSTTSGSAMADATRVRTPTGAVNLELEDNMRVYGPPKC